MRTSLALLPFLAIACDSPGGGGGGQVNCAVTPNVPICNPDVSDTVSPDTSAPDTSDTSDTSGPIDPDTTQPDTTQPDTTQPDTTQPDTTPPAECTGSSTRCSGAEAQVCSGGFWVTTQVCSGNTTCQNGSCVPTSTCTNGTRRCSGSTVEQCMNGQWAFAETCSNGCSNNACTAPPTGNLACDAIYDCAFESGCVESDPISEPCLDTCRAQGTTAAVQQLNAVMSCYVECEWLASCAVDTCSQLEANCFFAQTGTRTCTGIFDCLETCASNDAVCVDTCIGQGTKTAQGQFLRVNGCMYYFCDTNELCEACYDAAIACGF